MLPLWPEIGFGHMLVTQKAANSRLPRTRGNQSKGRAASIRTLCRTLTYPGSVCFLVRSCSLGQPCKKGNRFQGCLKRN